MRLKSVGIMLALFGLASSVTPVMSQAAVSKSSTTMTVVGAETLESLMLLWEDAYRRAVPAFKLNFQATMSSSAIQDLIDGKTSIAPVTREMNAEELKAFKAKWNYAPTRIAVAMDALVILVNKNNPIKEIKMEQLDAAWTTSRLQGWPRDIKVWGDLGLTATNWSDRPIRLVGQPEGSGVRDFFRHAVELDGTAKPNIERGTDVMSMVDTIITDQSTMGYGSVSQVYTSTKSIPVVPVGTKSAIEPTQSNVANGTYPLTMFAYMYVNKAPGTPLDPTTNRFMLFVLSKEGQKQVQLDGHVPLPEDLLQMGLRRLEH